MHRRRPGRRTHRVRLPGTTALVGVALLTACGSSGHGPASPPSTTSEVAGTQSSSRRTGTAVMYYRRHLREKPIVRNGIDLEDLIRQIRIAQTAPACK